MKQDTNDTFALLLKQARTIKGMTQKELGIAVGVTRDQVSNWEIPRSKPDIDVIKKLASVLDVSIEYLLGEDLEHHIVEYGEEKHTVLYPTIDKAKGAGLTDEQIKEAIEFAIKMKTQGH